MLRTLRNHLLQIRPHYNVETVNGVLLRNSRGRGRAVPALRGALRPGRCRATARRPSTAADDDLRARAAAGRQPARRRDPARPREPDRGGRAHQLLPEARAAGHLDQGRLRARSTAMVSPRPMFEIYVHSRLPRGHPPARRQGGARRHPLERPPRRLPHRGPGPDEDPDGQERDHRAGRLARAASSSRATCRRGRRSTQYLIDRYREFVSGLLDVTDNIVDGKVAASARRGAPRRRRPLPRRRRRQGHGAPLRHRQRASRRSTASGWATPSPPGGSVGYDHKKVGITARGAWECVKHHFRNLGHRRADASRSRWSGIGDMSGDVFGNGMLLSRRSELVGGLQPPHIFIDPDPDPERASPSASGCSRCRARPGATTTPR